MTSPKLAEQVWAERLDHEALCLYFASGAMAGTDATKATDLYVLARLRSRLDFLRCETWPHGPTSSAMAALRMTAEGQLVQAGVKNVQSQLIAAARLNETYDYVPEDPGQMCDGGPLKSVKDWKAERDRMQSEAEAMSKTQAP